MGQKTNPISLRPRDHYQINDTVPTSAIVLRTNIVNFFAKKGLHINYIRISEQNKNLLLNISFFFSCQNKIFTKHARRALTRRLRTKYNVNKIRENNIGKRVSSYSKSLFLKGLNKKFFERRFTRSFFRPKVLLSANNKNIGVVRSEAPNKKKIFLSLLKKTSCPNTVLYSFDRCTPNRRSTRVQQFWKVFKLHVSFHYRKKVFVNDLFWATACLLERRASAILINTLIVRAFRRLPKKEHRSFFFFLKNLFSAILSADNKLCLRGFKLQVSGRFGAKPRSKVQEFTIGQVASQTFSLPLDYSCLNSCTTLGSFGFKLFIAKNHVVQP